MLHPELKSLLQSLRQRVRRYVVLDSLLAILAVVLGGFWLGLLVDYLPVKLGGTEMPRLARGLLLAAVALIVLLIVGRLLIARLIRPLPDDSLALLFERHYPQLGGRLITAVQLTRPDRSGDAHSPELLKMVHREASQSVDQLDPGRVFRLAPLVNKASIALPLLGLAIAMAVVSPSSFTQAAARLTLMSDARWPRQASLEMVGVDLPVITPSSEESAEMQRLSFEDGTLRLPKGSNGTLRIRAAAKDAVVPSVCTVYYQTEDGTRGQSNMRRVGRERDGYQAFVLEGPPLANLNESFRFSILGLDDRLSDFQVEAVDPPALTAMDVLVRYPDYLRPGGDGTRTEFDLETRYQAGLRISEGSDITLRGSSSRLLGKVEAVMEQDGSEVPLTGIEISDDRKSFQLQIDSFRRPTAIRLVPSDPEGISAQAPFRYFLGAVIDQPPDVSLTLQGIQTAVTPVARIPIQCTARDDYSVESLTASLSTTLQAEEEEAAASEQEDANDQDSVPADSENPDNSQDPGDADDTERQNHSVTLDLDRDGTAATVMDLRELINTERLQPISPGDVVNVYAEARDGYDLDGRHVTSSEMFRLKVVTAEELLSLLERRELGLRTRLEQTVTETRGLREQLERFRADRFELPEVEAEDARPAAAREDEAAAAEKAEAERQRQLQIIRLRVQQSGLQASKTTEELAGIAESLDDILQEMVNNRVDSPDRQERLGNGVRDPLRQISQTAMQQLKTEIAAIEAAVENPDQAVKNTESALKTTDEVLLQLEAILEKMLDLESYNELLDLVRGLIEDQEKLKEDTQEERKKSVLELFE
jgi:hypothetical protein